MSWVSYCTMYLKPLPMVTLISKNMLLPLVFDYVDVVVVVVVVVAVVFVVVVVVVEMEGICPIQVTLRLIGVDIVELSFLKQQDRDQYGTKTKLMRCL